MKRKKTLWIKKKKKIVFLKFGFYTLGIIILSSVITFFLSKSMLSTTKASSPEPVNAETELYEKGSPYDAKLSEENGKVLFHGPRDSAKVALTFDAEMTDGMKAAFLSGKVKSSYDKRIIDTLNETNTKATFFLTGMWIELYPKETAEFAANPLFELGSHSYTDSSYHGSCYGLNQLTKQQAIEDLGTTEKLLREKAGVDNHLFRFPGGCYGPEDVDLVNEIGDTVVHWDVVGGDGFNTNTESIVRAVVDTTQNGSIIVLHMNGEPTAPKTAEALPEIIKELQAKGFEFVKVSELLNLPEENNIQQ